MSKLTIQHPDALKKHGEDIAAKKGYSVNRFLASAAGEKRAASVASRPCSGWPTPSRSGWRRPRVAFLISFIFQLPPSAPLLKDETE